MRPSEFIHLRVVSSYSLCYGALKIGEIVELAKKNKMPAVSIADKGNFFALLEFSLAAVKSGIQPIVAVSLKIDLGEEYNDDSDEILLIARNENGYHNLIKLVSYSFLYNSKSGENYSNLQDLAKFNSDLIALIGYRKGCLYEMHKNNQHDQASKLIDKYQEIFSDIYIELSRMNYEAENLVEPRLLKTALAKNLPIVATNDVKFATYNMGEAQDILTCIASNQYFDDPNRTKDNYEHYFKTSASMIELFRDLPEAIENTVNIAKKCSFFPDSAPPSLPNFSTEDRNENEELIYQSEQGLQERLEQYNIASELHEEYKQRLKYELEVIQKMGFPGYFLIVSDFINGVRTTIFQ